MARTSYGIAVGALIASLSAAAWAQAPAGAAPVVVQGRTLFTVQTSLGPFTAQDRAAATSERLTRIARDLTASIDAIAAVNGETSTDIALGDRVLLTVTDADAKAANRYASINQPTLPEVNRSLRPTSDANPHAVIAPANGDHFQRLL